MKTYNEMMDEKKKEGIVPNTSSRTYDPSADYTAQMQEEEKAGNVVGAMDNELLHNKKDGDLALGWGASGKYNYLDPVGYGGLLDAKYSQIENYKPFSYDYRQDDSYKAIRSLKEKEAEKAYADGYAQLSTQFDGDIPVNMINKLLTTKAEITDSADAYIPQLKQMAYDMHNADKNELYNQYGMLRDRAAEDYSRWYADRDFRTQGIYDAAEREYRKNRDAIEDGLRQKQWDYGIEQDSKQWDYGIGRDKKEDNIKYYSLVKTLVDKGMSWDEAEKKVDSYLNRNAG